MVPEASNLAFCESPSVLWESLTEATAQVDYTGVQNVEYEHARLVDWHLAAGVLSGARRRR